MLKRELFRVINDGRVRGLIDNILASGEGVLADEYNLWLTMHASRAQATPVEGGIPWLGFVVYPTHRKLKRRNVVQFRRRLERNISLYRQGAISFGELDVTVQGWINHVRYADT